MKVLELQLPEQTASRLQEAAERLIVSPDQLSILSIEEKLAQLEDEFRRSTEYVLETNADLYRRLPDALLIYSGSHLATPTLNLTK